MTEAEGRARAEHADRLEDLEQAHIVRMQGNRFNVRRNDDGTLLSSHSTLEDAQRELARLNKNRQEVAAAAVLRVCDSQGYVAAGAYTDEVQSPYDAAAAWLRDICDDPALHEDRIVVDRNVTWSSVLDDLHSDYQHRTLVAGDRDDSPDLWVELAESDDQ